MPWAQGVVSSNLAAPTKYPLFLVLVLQTRVPPAAGVRGLSQCEVATNAV